MSCSHEEPVRCNNFQKVTPRHSSPLVLDTQIGSLFFLYEPFLSSSVKIDLIYPELCLLLDKTHTHTGKHAEASKNAPAELIGLSLTVAIIVWLVEWRKLLCNGSYLYIFPSLFQVFVALFKSDTTLNTLYMLWVQKCFLFLSAGDVCVSRHCTGVIFDKTCSLDVGHDGFKLGSGDGAGLQHASRDLDHLSH